MTTNDNLDAIRFYQRRGFRLTAILGVDCPLLGQIPFDPDVCATRDQGIPMVITDPESTTSAAFRAIATTLADRPRGIAGMSLAVYPTG